MVRRLFRQQNGSRDSRRMTEYNLRKTREAAARRAEENPDVQSPVTVHQGVSLGGVSGVEESTPIARDIPEDGVAPRRVQLFEEEEEEELDYSSDTVESHAFTSSGTDCCGWCMGDDSPPQNPQSQDTRAQAAEVRQLIGGVSIALITTLDIQEIKEKLKELKAGGDHDRAVRTRKDLWIFCDLKSGVVDPSLSDSERVEAVDRLVDLVVEEDVSELEDAVEAVTGEDSDGDIFFDALDCEPDPII